MPMVTRAPLPMSSLSGGIPTGHSRARRKAAAESDKVAAEVVGAVIMRVRSTGSRAGIFPVPHVTRCSSIAAMAASSAAPEGSRRWPGLLAPHMRTRAAGGHRLPYRALARANPAPAAGAPSRRRSPAAVVRLRLRVAGPDRAGLRGRGPDPVTDPLYTGRV